MVQNAVRLCDSIRISWMMIGNKQEIISQEVFLKKSPGNFPVSLATCHVWRGVRVEEAAPLQSDPVQIPLPSNIATWASHFFFFKRYGATDFLAAISNSLTTPSRNVCYAAACWLRDGVTYCWCVFCMIKTIERRRKLKKKVVHANQFEIIHFIPSIFCV